MKAAPPMTITNLGTYRAQRLAEANLEQRDAAWHDLEACYTQAIDQPQFGHVPLPPIYGNDTDDLEGKIENYELKWSRWWVRLTPEDRSALDASPVIIR